MLVFCLQGTFLGIIGILLGAGSGLGLCSLLEKYNFIKLPSDVYYISKLPVLVDIKDVSLIVGCSIVICVIAGVYPAFKASRLNPVEALRYE